MQETEQRGATPVALLYYSYGGEVSGDVFGRLSFDLRITRNAEQLPDYLNAYTSQLHTLPGVGYYTGNGPYTYWNNTGYLSYSVLKKYVELSIGRGKNFVGDGIHSLFLSDNSAPVNFIKLNTRVWKFNYQNLFVELTPEFADIDKQSPHSYMAIHYLTMNVSRWLNAGVFETIVFNRPNSFETDYLNPVVFYRYTERTNGSPDNVLLGFTLKATAAKTLQFYGQFVLDEFTQKQFFGGKGYWANKFGIQTGMKYFDVLAISNLDIQLEMDAVRPFTYSHSDTVINYTNYNQLMADPWGSGFIGATGRLSYRPADRWSIGLTGTYYVRGADSGGVNYGNNALLNYVSRYADFGVHWISGVHTNCGMAGVNVSYRLYEHLLIDLGGMIRNYSSSVTSVPLSTTNGSTTGNSTTVLYYIGIRLNAPRRAYDAYF